jgi:hypothetical protein
MYWTIMKPIRDLTQQDELDAQGAEELEEGVTGEKDEIVKFSSRGGQTRGIAV